MDIKNKYNLVALQILIKQFKTLDRHAGFEISNEEIEKANEYINLFNENLDKNYIFNNRHIDLNTREYASFYEPHNNLFKPFDTLPIMVVSNNKEDNFELFENFLNYLIKLLSEVKDNQEYIIYDKTSGMHYDSWKFYFNSELEFVKYNAINDNDKYKNDKMFQLLTDNITEPKLGKWLQEYDKKYSIKDSDDLGIMVYYKRIKKSFTQAKKALSILRAEEENIDVSKYLLKHEIIPYIANIVNPKILEALGNKITNVQIKFELHEYDTINQLILNDIKGFNKEQIIGLRSIDFKNIRKIVLDTYKYDSIKAKLEHNDFEILNEYTTSVFSFSTLPITKKVDNNILKLKIEDMDCDLLECIYSFTNKDLKDNTIFSPEDLLNNLTSIKSPDMILKISNLYNYMLDNKILFLKLI